MNKKKKRNKKAAYMSGQAHGLQLNSATPAPWQGGSEEGLTISPLFTVSLGLALSPSALELCATLGASAFCGHILQIALYSTNLK